MKTVQRMHLVSNRLCYGPCPMPEDEIEQHLTIRKDGCIWLSRYAFGNGRPYRRTSIEYYKIEPTLAADALSKLGAYFFADHINAFVTDIGTWSIKLFSDDGLIFKEAGSLCGVNDSNIDFSKMLRDMIPADNLFLFKAP